MDVHTSLHFFPFETRQHWSRLKNYISSAAIILLSVPSFSPPFPSTAFVAARSKFFLLNLHAPELLVRCVVAPHLHCVRFVLLPLVFLVAVLVLPISNPMPDAYSVVRFSYRSFFSVASCLYALRLFTSVLPWYSFHRCLLCTTLSRWATKEAEYGTSTASNTCVQYLRNPQLWVPTMIAWRWWKELLSWNDLDLGVRPAWLRFFASLVWVWKSYILWDKKIRFRIL